MNKNKDLKKLGLLSWILILILILLFGYFIYIFSVSSENIKAAIMSGAIAVGMAIYSHSSLRRREIEERQFQSKSEAYKIFFDFYFNDLFLNNKKGTPIDLSSDKILEKIFNIKKEFFIWASPQTLKAFSQIGTSDKHEIIMSQVSILMRQIRKDLGHKDEELEDTFYIKYMLAPGEWEKLEKDNKEKEKEKK